MTENGVLAFITLCKSFQPIIFLGKFFCFFSTDSNSASKFAFYDTHIEYLQKKFRGGESYYHFLPTLEWSSDKIAQKTNDIFYKCVLKFNFASISASFCQSRSKSLYPTYGMTEAKGDIALSPFHSQW